MNILVLGAGGQIARALIACAPSKHTLIVKSRRDLDISDEMAVMDAASNSGAQWLINCAAYTAVDRAELEPNEAHKINGVAPGILARAATRVGARLLHLSTDFVFDGASNRAYLPTDRTNPLSVYGASKVAGELAVQQESSNSIIFRTAWVHASTGRNFVSTMLRLLRERNEVRVVSDQIGTPTWAGGIAPAIWSLIEDPPIGGIYHWTDLGVASWYDFAAAIQDEGLELGLLARAVPVFPVLTADYPTPARRPAFSVLNSENARALVKAPARHWRHNLRLMLNEL